MNNLGNIQIDQSKKSIQLSWVIISNKTEDIQTDTRIILNNNILNKSMVVLAGMPSTNHRVVGLMPLRMCVNVSLSMWRLVRQLLYEHVQTGERWRVYVKVPWRAVKTRKCYINAVHLSFTTTSPVPMLDILPLLPLPLPLPLLPPAPEAVLPWQTT